MLRGDSHASVRKPERTSTIQHISQSHTRLCHGQTYRHIRRQLRVVVFVKRGCHLSVCTRIWEGDGAKIAVQRPHLLPQHRGGGVDYTMTFARPSTQSRWYEFVRSQDTEAHNVGRQTYRLHTDLLGLSETARIPTLLLDTCPSILTAAISQST